MSGGGIVAFYIDRERKCTLGTLGTQNRVPFINILPEIQFDYPKKLKHPNLIELFVIYI